MGPTDRTSSAAAGQRSTQPSTAHDSNGATSAAARAAERVINASRQGGVVNPAELARELTAAQARDPAGSANLRAAVNAQLSERDRSSLAEHLAPTLAAVAGARAAPAMSLRAMPPQGLSTDQFTDVSRTVRTKAGEMALGSDIVVQGSRAERTARPTSDLDLAIRVPAERFDQFLNNESRLASPNPGSAAERTRTNAEANGIVQRGEARLSPTGRAIEQRLGMDVDLSVVRRGGAFDQGTSLALRTETSTARALGSAGAQGALIGSVVDGALTAGAALRDGRLTAQEGQDVLASTARGAVVGGTYAVTEHGLVRAIDRTAGSAIESAAARTAARAGLADTALAGAMTRTAATRLAGAGAAGAVISAGVSVFENRDGLARGDSRAIGNVAGDTVVGASAVVAGMAAGAAIGSVVPVAGTAVGAVVGLVVGAATDYVLRAGGVDKAIAQTATAAVDAVKGAASRVAGWLGW